MAKDEFTYMSTWWFAALPLRWQQKVMARKWRKKSKCGLTRSRRRA